MYTDVPIPFEEPADDAWLVDLIGRSAVRAMTAFAVPCLHYAHWEAMARLWQADWTNTTTYGVDRYHCFSYTFAEAIERYLSGVIVRRPTDRIGTPFTIAGGDWLVYPWRYGSNALDPIDGLKFAEETGIRSKLVAGEPSAQMMLDYPDLPAIALSKIVILAWAGNDETGLERAFIGRPYLLDGRVHWRDRVDLDLDNGRAEYGAPPAPANADGVNRNGQVARPNPIDLDEIARGNGIDADRGDD